MRRSEPVTSLILVALLSAGMIIAPSVLAVHDEGIFELDGNAVDQAAAGDDWENGTPGADDTLFIPGSVDKCRAVRDRVGASIDVEVDGGVDLSNAGTLALAGASILVAGASIFAQADPAAATRALGDVAPELSRRLWHWLNDKPTDKDPVALAEDVPEVIPRFSRLGVGEELVLIFLEDTSLYSQRAEELTLTTLGRLSASITHEIRNPLAAISHAAELLHEEEKTVEDRTRLTRIIHDNTLRLERLVADVLQLNRRDRANAEPIELRPWLDGFVAEFAANESLPRARIAVDAARDGKPMPQGTYLFVEVFGAKLDDQKKPIKGPDGHFAEDKLLFYTAMETQPEWGSEFPDLLRNGDWNYAVFLTDRTVRPGVNQAECLACHKPLARDSFVFTLKTLQAKAQAMKSQLQDAQKQMRDGAQKADGPPHRLVPFLAVPFTVRGAQSHVFERVVRHGVRLRVPHPRVVQAEIDRIEPPHQRRIAAHDVFHLSDDLHARRAVFHAFHLPEQFVVFRIFVVRVILPVSLDLGIRAVQQEQEILRIRIVGVPSPTEKLERALVHLFLEPVVIGRP